MKMNLRTAFFAALAIGLALPVSAGDLKLTMNNGRVTIIATDVPLRQILQEWARVGQTRIINADKLSGPPMTLQLIDATEKDALDILLRSASGYIAAPRAVAVANAGAYDRITIMATSRAPAAAAMSAAAPPPTFQRPPQPVDDSDEPVVNVTMPAQPQPYVPPMQPMPFNPNGNNNNQVIVNPASLVPPGGFNPGNGQAPQQQGPLTAPRPGMVIPANGAPNPYQPTVVRPPGGGGPGGGGEF